jgi:hypothetical protein
MKRLEYVIIAALVMMLLSLVVLITSCAPPVPRVTPSDVIVELVRFHGDVAAQYQQGGMELEHFLVVTQWIGDELRVLQTQPKQWEGQARLDWPRVRSIVVPFEALGPAVARIDQLVQ